eukprot:GFYU01000829.1.p1 GENE.GFYU01000829.1~~GFYU01000829.1.p1  ORF type:complete len:682 (-),score=271.98 GFYU01000829.1:229-2274(-)
MCGCCLGPCIGCMGDAPTVQYTVKAAEPENPGETPIYRNAAFPDKLTDDLYGAKTLYENFQRGVTLAGNRNCLGYRPIDEQGNAGAFVWESYTKIYDRVLNFGSGLLKEGLVNETSDKKKFLALWSKNRKEWVVAEQACNAYSVISVPLYDTLGPEAVDFVLLQTECETVVCSSKETDVVISKIKPAVKTLKAFVQMDGDLSDKQRSDAKAAGIKAYTMTELEEIGAKNKQDVIPPKPDDIATFCYTSGTTGDPKGAMLTHGNICAGISAAYAGGVQLGPGDVHISYLPLAHMFERIVQAVCFNGGTAIGFYQGDPLKLLDDLAVLRPTLFPSVPRLWNRIYDKITQGAEAGGGLKASLFKKAMNSKLAWLKKGKTTHCLWDTLVFSKVAKRVGLDRVKYMVTGSAPIPGHVMDFLRIAFPGARMVEGYAQTENVASGTLTHLDDVHSGTVGGPSSCNELKLVDVAEMGYLSTDTAHGEGDDAVACIGRGEVCVRGPNVFAGYYKLPEKTEEALDNQGWLHSGDIGILLPNGALKIVDRKKNIFKLSQGEYVAAEKIENIYMQSHFIAQCFIYGDSLKSFLVAIIVPDQEYITKWGPENGISGTFEEQCKNPKLKEAILNDMKAVAKGGGLKGFENARDIHVDSELFTAENNLLTPTFKLKRNDAKKKYISAIDKMYEGKQ